MTIAGPYAPVPQRAVLKPGGHVAIVDIAATGLYERELNAAPGMIDVRRSGAGALFLPTSKRVTATKRP